MESRFSEAANAAKSKDSLVRIIRNRVIHQACSTYGERYIMACISKGIAQQIRRSKGQKWKSMADVYAELVASVRLRRKMVMFSLATYKRWVKLEMELQKMSLEELKERAFPAETKGSAWLSSLQEASLAALALSQGIVNDPMGRTSIINTATQMVREDGEVINTKDGKLGGEWYQSFLARQNLS